MSSVTITRFLFDDENEEKFAAHNVSAEQVYQALRNPHIIVSNRKERRARHLLIGRDDGGACLAIPVTPTTDPAIWRPVTAWRCKDRELAVLERKGI